MATRVDKNYERLATMKFRPQNVSPLAWTFRSREVLHSGRFAVGWTFCFFPGCFDLNKIRGRFGCFALIFCDDH